MGKGDVRGVRVFFRTRVRGVGYGLEYWDTGMVSEYLGKSAGYSSTWVRCKSGRCHHTEVVRWWG